MRNLYILSAPSGTGKNTVFTKLQALMPTVQRAITCTTREMRSDETDKVDYYFLSEAEFDAKSKNGEFVEENVYDGHKYGTLRAEIERHDEKQPLFLIIDVNGKEKTIKEYPYAVNVFIKPPSLEEMERRIRGRGENSEQEIARRIEEAHNELSKAHTYAYVLVNNVAEECARELLDIVLKTMR
jgi:guanylate kinase